MKRLMIVLLLAAVVAPVAGCVVAPVGPGPYSGAYWVPGHFGPYGGWHPGHWA
jgi:hypothetical protein